MSDHDQTVMSTVNGNRGHIRRLGSFDDFTFGEEQPADVATGLVSLGFIGAAIKRNMRLWLILAVVGLIGGLGYYYKAPPAAKASTSVLLTYGPSESPASAIFDNQTMAESHTVAQLAMKKLGDTTDPVGTFAASYVVGVVTDRILVIQASAPSSAQAVARAQAIAQAFLQFRASQEQVIQKAQVGALTQEEQAAQQDVDNLKGQVSTAQTQGASTAQVKKLTLQLNQANVNLSVIQQEIAATSSGTATIAANAGSVILDPAAPLPASKTKKLLEYAVYGLIGGLVVGMAIAAIGAVVSDRLRRRDDVARALGAPVRLSVGPVRLAGRLPRTKRGLAAAEDVEVKQIVAHLRGVVPVRERKVALAVIPVDQPDVAALSVVALATSCAEDGRRVVVADLAAGAPVAALLGVQGPGVKPVPVGKAQLILAVPGEAEIAPSGPVGRPADGQRSEFTEQVNAACGSADLLLTLIPLDPSLGADHLPSWASSAVAMVTAGKASWTKLHAVGEMVRLAGTSLVSTVLVGADKSDESLGVLPEADALLRIGELS
jgi:capsular polysaccharide biosynthesis protein